MNTYINNEAKDEKILAFISSSSNWDKLDNAIASLENTNRTVNDHLTKAYHIVQECRNQIISSARNDISVKRPGWVGQLVYARENSDYHTYLNGINDKLATFAEGAQTLQSQLEDARTTLNDMQRNLENPSIEWSTFIADGCRIGSAINSAYTTYKSAHSSSATSTQGTGAAGGGAGTGVHPGGTKKVASVAGNNSPATPQPANGTSPGDTGGSNGASGNGSNNACPGGSST